jgi:hypothetical protein
MGPVVGRLGIVLLVGVGFLSLVIPAAISQARPASSRGQSILGPGARGRVDGGYALPAGPVDPPPCTKVPVGPPPPPLPPPLVPESSIPSVASPGRRHVSLAALGGKGVWITVFPESRLNPASVVRSARRAGLDALYLRTGSSSEGFYGGPLLQKLVPLAHRFGIAVVAWDFPTLSDPATDAARAADAFGYGVDAFSADIEGKAEGTYLSARRVAYYLSLVRKDAGSRPVVATVPRPTTPSLSAYPYQAEAPFVDAFAPMVYWSCTEPGAAVAVAIEALRPLRPVVPIGQDYDMGDEGGPKGLPSGSAVWRFVDVARRDGAIGVSLYDFESGGQVQLAALADYPWRHLAAGRRSRLNPSRTADTG